MQAITLRILHHAREPKTIEKLSLVAQLHIVAPKEFHKVLLIEQGIKYIYQGHYWLVAVDLLDKAPSFQADALAPFGIEIGSYAKLGIQLLRGQAIAYNRRNTESSQIFVTLKKGARKIDDHTFYGIVLEHIDERVEAQAVVLVRIAIAKAAIKHIAQREAIALAIGRILISAALTQHLQAVFQAIILHLGGCKWHRANALPIAAVFFVGLFVYGQNLVGKIFFPKSGLQLIARIHSQKVTITFETKGSKGKVEALREHHPHLPGSIGRTIDLLYFERVHKFHLIVAGNA